MIAELVLLYLLVGTVFMIWSLDFMGISPVKPTVFATTVLIWPVMVVALWVDVIGALGNK